MRYSGHSDQQLVALYQKGKEEAFKELLNRYKSRVYGKIYMYVRDRAAADDIFQDTFVKAIDALKGGQYNEEGKFSAWILRITHNLCIDTFRVQKKMPRAKITDDFDPMEVIASSEKNYEDGMSDKQVLSDVKKIIGFLPKEQKEIVMMRLYYDMSFKEISETLDIPINTALGRMRYALIKMRRLVEANGVHLVMS